MSVVLLPWVTCVWQYRNVGRKDVIGNKVYSETENVYLTLFEDQYNRLLKDFPLSNYIKYVQVILYYNTLLKTLSNVLNFYR